MGARLLIVSVAAALLVAGCGDDGDEDGGSPGGGEIRVEASSSEDQTIGDDLVTYLERNLEANPDQQESYERACEDPEPAVQEECDQAKVFLEAYGTVDEIEVTDGVITIHTGVDGDSPDAELIGQSFCDLIQGADVSDLEEHTVLGGDDEVLKECPGRTDLG